MNIFDHRLVLYKIENLESDTRNIVLYIQKMRVDNNFFIDQYNYVLTSIIKIKKKVDLSFLEKCKQYNLDIFLSNDVFDLKNVYKVSYENGLDFELNNIQYIYDSFISYIEMRKKNLETEIQNNNKLLTMSKHWYNLKGK